MDELAVDWRLLRRVDLNLLPVFEMLLQTRSTTRCAHLLSRTQPAISRDLARLREMLGDPLFVKVQGRLEPTPQALQMWPRLKSALADLDSTLAGSAQFDPARARDDFHIGCNSSVELTLSSWMAEHFDTNAPSVTVRFSAVRAAVAPEEALESGEMQLAVGRFQSMPTSCLSQHLAADQRVCLVRQGHPILSRPLTLKRLASLKFVTTTAMKGIANDLDVYLASQGLERAFPLMVSTLALAPHVLMSSNYATTLPRQVARQIASRFALAIAELPPGVPSTRYTMVWSRRWDAVESLKWLRRQVERALTAQFEGFPS
jgi:DNA-binding transcriptional LysR family regulator